MAVRTCADCGEEEIASQLVIDMRRAVAICKRCANLFENNHEEMLRGTSKLINESMSKALTAQVNPVPGAKICPKCNRTYLYSMPNNKKNKRAMKYVHASGPCVVVETPKQ